MTTDISSRGRRAIGRLVRHALASAGYDLVQGDRGAIPGDLDPAVQAILRAVRPYTMTTPDRIAALCAAVSYVAVNRIPGALVECGVWRGGSMMAAAHTLVAARERDRDLWLFDTFTGMTSPSVFDRRSWDAKSAAEILSELGSGQEGNIWCEASIDEVRANLLTTGYPPEHSHFVKGPVEETIPHDGLHDIAILRLDTDWYESTLHELLHLYPRIVPGGVLIIDDYGEWDGARRATDEFLATVSPKPLLVRVDASARVAVIPGLPP